MTYPYPGDLTVIAQLLVDKITLAKATFRVPVIDVFYGDQDRIPHTPSVCVEPNAMQRNLEGAPNMTMNEFEVFILVYHNAVQELQKARKEVDQVAYDISKLIHQDLQLKNGGATPNVIHGFIRAQESGYTFKQNTLFRSARLTYYCKNKTSLPTA